MLNPAAKIKHIVGKHEEDKKREEQKKRERAQQPTRLKLGMGKVFEYASVKWFIGAFFICLILWGLIIGFTMQALKIGYHKKYIVLLTLLPTAFSNVISGVITAIIALGTLRYLYAFKVMNTSDVIIDPFNGVEVAVVPIYGDSHWQYEEEIERCFFRAEGPSEIHHNLNILGEGVFDHKLYSLRDDLVSMNRHMAVFGTPGSGKSATFVTNMIYQNILRGDSIIVTDSKGDLCTENAKLCRKHGYEVRILDLKAKELMFSDGCDFLKPLKDDDVKATVLANTITTNTEGSPGLDYWAKNEMNLLKALMLYVANDPVLIKHGKSNLAEVYNIISTKRDEEITDMFGLIDDDHPAKQAFNIFDNISDEKIRGQIINGLGIRLQILGNKWAKKLVSADEISLIAPMKRKCAYFVVIDDQDDAFKFIATLFFASLFQEMCNYFDAMKQIGRADECLPVNFLLDEFKATGSIPRFDLVVANVRSRGIGITMILQDLKQLEAMYDENLASSILNGMPVKVLLKTADPVTAEYFSKLLDIETVKVRNGRHERGAADFFRLFPSFQESDGWGKREVMTPGELMEMNNDHLVICISGFRPVRLKKFLFFRHPMSKECEKFSPRKHTPKWRKEIDERRKKEGKPPIYVEKGFDYEESAAFGEVPEEDQVDGTMKEAMEFINETKAQYEAKGEEYNEPEFTVEYEEVS